MYWKSRDKQCSCHTLESYVCFILLEEGVGNGQETCIMFTRKGRRRLNNKGRVDGIPHELSFLSIVCTESWTRTQKHKHTHTHINSNLNTNEHNSNYSHRKTWTFRVIHKISHSMQPAINTQYLSLRRIKDLKMARVNKNLSLHFSSWKMKTRYEQNKYGFISSV